MAKKKGRRKARRRKTARRAGVRRRAAASYGAGSVSSVVASLSAAHQQLLKERDGLDRKISAIAGVIATFGAPTAGRRRGAGRAGGAGGGGGRRYRSGSLKEYIARVMGGRGVMAVKDITLSVVKAGYKSKNKTLAKSVGIALTEMSDVNKVGRGRYRRA